MSLTPRNALLAGASIVGASTVVLPSITGYGTVLFQLVALGAWSIVAAASSGIFADTHHGIVWSVAFFVNLIAFSIVAVPIWAVARKWKPKVGAIALVLWTALYLAALFVLFPATDGP